MVTKINPVYDITLPRSFNGKTVAEINIDLGADASASTGPEGAIAKVLQVVALRCTPIMISDLTGTGQLMTIFVEGDFPTDTYDGENAETFAAFLATEIAALGTVDTVNLSGAAATAGTVYQADQTNT